MKNVLRDCLVAATGDFGALKSHDNLKRWVENNGGTWSVGADTDITHLICSAGEWKKQTETVKAARKLKTVKIVSYDWLEDSLLNRKRKREAKYEYVAAKKKTAAGVQRERKARKKDVREFNKGCSKAKLDLMSGIPSLWLTSEYRSALMGNIEGVPDGYHLYRDSNGHIYDVPLERGRKSEKYMVRLYESHAFPHQYATHVRYDRPKCRPIIQTEATAGSTFEVAFREFRKIFLAKTKVSWEDRHHAAGGERKKGSRKSESDVIETTPFRYIAAEGDKISLRGG